MGEIIWQYFLPISILINLLYISVATSVINSANLQVKNQENVTKKEFQHHQDTISYTLALNQFNGHINALAINQHISVNVYFKCYNFGTPVVYIGHLGCTVPGWNSSCPDRGTT